MSVRTRDAGAFLRRASDAAVDLGPLGLRLTSVAVEPGCLGGFTADESPPTEPTDLDAAFPLALIPASGAFASHEERRTSYWQPAAAAAGYLHLAWLLNDLADEASRLAESGLVLVGVESPDPSYADVLLGAGTREGAPCHRVRFRLTHRTGPLEWPGMWLREILTEGTYARWVTLDPGLGEVVDVRDVV